MHAPLRALATYHDHLPTCGPVRALALSVLGPVRCLPPYCPCSGRPIELADLCHAPLPCSAPVRALPARAARLPPVPARGAPDGHEAPRRPAVLPVVPAQGATEKLAIFGPRRGRRGAELKVMAAVETKVPGYFTERMVVPEDDKDGFGTRTLVLKVRAS